MTTTTLLAQELSPLNWSGARLILIAHFLIGVIKLRTVNLVRLAGVFDTKVEVDSNYKRLQRFFRHFELDFDAVARLIYRWLPSGEWILCLDRTNWQIGTTSVNVLVLAVAYRGIAIPLIWTGLNKKGNSSTKERITLLERFIKLFGKERIAYLTADREFRGHDWLRYLVSEQIPFRVRIPNNTQVPNRHRNQTVPVTRLFRLRVGEVMVLSSARRVWGISVYLGAVRTPEELAIIIANAHNQHLVADYARRWEIETLFGCLKSRGFDLEQTRLRDPQRLSKLLALLAMAFCWCYRIGEWQATQKPIRRLKHGRPVYCLFRYGLDYLSRILFQAGSRFGQFKEILEWLFGKKTTINSILC
jgi:hypothetical protein